MQKIRPTFVGLAIALFLGLALRLVLWENLPRIGLISDEGEYASAANWLADGRAFDWYQGYLWTRAPLYPLFLAAHLLLFGRSFAPIFATQILLSLLNIGLVWVLARRLAHATNTPPWSATLAACLAGLFLPFASYTQTLLSETLFITLMLGIIVVLTTQPLRPRDLLRAGVLLGLATLTRSLALGFIPLVACWLLLQAQPQRWRKSALLVGACALTILPWSLYNSRMYGGLVLVDTSGAFNLLLGARTAYDGKRSDAQVRDYVLGILGQPTSAPIDESCQPFPGPLPSQAARQQAMSREGLCLIQARPLAFIEKSLAELIDLFQINYTGAERFSTGFSTGRLHPAYLLALFLLDDTLYVLGLPLAIIGWAIARRSTHPLISLSGLWWGYNIAVAPLLFAINRFRIPLMPLVFIFAAFAIAHLLQRRSQAPIAQPAAWRWLTGTLAALLFLVAATPYAYLEPRAAEQPSRWASYLGPYPSSLDITMRALAARPLYERDQEFANAISTGDLTRAAALLEQGGLGRDLSRLGPSILAARQGDPAAALAALPATATISAERDAYAAVLRGDLLRTLGDQPAALAALSERIVDDANPVAWAWQWLQPAPTRQINLGGSLDLGYINGCYLGEGDTSITPPANFRWCGATTQLRFPAAATGASQTLLLRADGRAWQSYTRSAPAVQVLLNGQPVGSFRLNLDQPAEYRIPLPAQPAGSTFIITLLSPTFVPDAARYNSQQGEAVVGQIQPLGIRLDWAEVQP
ncbi:MAG: glycosyltransferase family 39 protein [Roseiflexaceae bacterium]